MGKVCAEPTKAARAKAASAIDLKECCIVSLMWVADECDLMRGSVVRERAWWAFVVLCAISSSEQRRSYSWIAQMKEDSGCCMWTDGASIG